jgi:uncharacterized membrane protein YuzA (DUF378 family)
MKMGPIGWIAFALVVIGGLNWGLVGIFNFDLVATIFGTMSTIARIVYILVGLSAVYMVFGCFAAKAPATAPASQV